MFPNCYIYTSQQLDDGWLTCWCGWHDAGNANHDNRPYLGSFLTKLPLPNTKDYPIFSHKFPLIVSCLPSFTTFSPYLVASIPIISQYLGLNPGCLLYITMIVIAIFFGVLLTILCIQPSNPICPYMVKGLYWVFVFANLFFGAKILNVCLA